MKGKRIFFFLSILCCLLVFSGCQCEHEWTEANCLSAMTCTRCGETQGEPLEHVYAAATCVAPETCSNCGATRGEPVEHTFDAATCAAPETCTRCGETRGEPLAHEFVFVCGAPETCTDCGATRGLPRDHEFSIWEIQGETMSRTCSVCGTEESAPVDHERILDSILMGHWNFYATYINGRYVAPKVEMDDGKHTIFQRAFFAKNTTFSVYIPVDTATDGFYRNGYERKFQEVRENSDGTLIYYFAYGFSGKEMSYTGFVYNFSNNLFLLDLVEEGYADIYTRSPELERAIVGTWVCVEDGQIRRLLFKPNGTLSGILFGQEVQGAWNVKLHGFEEGELVRVELTIYYYGNGTENIVEGSTGLYWYDVGQDNQLRDYLENNNLKLSFHTLDYSQSATYERMDEKDIARLEEELKEGA